MNIYKRTIKDQLEGMLIFKKRKKIEKENKFQRFVRGLVCAIIFIVVGLDYDMIIMLYIIFDYLIVFV